MFGNHQVSNHHRQSSVISALSFERSNFVDHDAADLFRRKTGTFGRKITGSESTNSSSSSGCFRRLQKFYEASRLHYFLPIIILVIYSFLGGFIFYNIESPEERVILEQKKEYILKEEVVLMREIQKIQQRTRYIFSKYPSLERKLLELRRYRPFAMNRLNKAVFWYVLQIYYLNDQESYKSLLHPNKPAVTTYSTIGYGNITPAILQIHLGKLAVILYAIVGIPLVLMILHKLGRFCLLGLEFFWNNVLWLMESVNCLKNGEKLKGKMKHEPGGGMPVLLAVGVAFGWMFLCAAIFLHFEDDWDYFKSFYFFFCSLTTIGYGDVTPTRAEDMFLMFGFVIIGLSLVSMCVNVIQLKLEELFEELLLSMMEEIGAQGASGRDLKPKLTAVDLWKMWKKRRRNKPKHKDQLPVDIEQQRKSLTTEFNFWKIFPFSKRRREVMIENVCRRLQQASKSTQTDASYGYSLHTLNYVQELDEISWNGTPSTNGNDAPLDNSPNNISSTTTSSSTPSDKKVRVRVAISENSSSMSPVISSSSSSSYVRRYLPSRRSERRHTIISNTTNTTYGGCSVQSAPNVVSNEPRGVSPHSAALMASGICIL
ncbi:Potassium channel subfamily K member 18 [Aphelenchoides bicaudatus]|nr:Potassium channel subfamily K member 18 [Aphelenchoides bicaudatus]